MNEWMPNEDMELLRDYVTRHTQQSFATLAGRHVNLVYSAGLGQTGDAMLPQEITQEVFLLLAHKAATLGPDTIVPSWLHRAAVYVAARARKRQRRRAQREQEAHMESIPQEPPNDLWRDMAASLTSLWPS